jgi:hypothetical protein
MDGKQQLVLSALSLFCRLMGERTELLLGSGTEDVLRTESCPQPAMPAWMHACTQMAERELRDLRHARLTPQLSTWGGEISLLLAEGKK